MTKKECDSRYITLDNAHTYFKTTCADTESTTFLPTDISVLVQVLVLL